MLWLWFLCRKTFLLFDIIYLADRKLLWCNSMIQFTQYNLFSITILYVDSIQRNFLLPTYLPFDTNVFDKYSNKSENIVFSGAKTRPLCCWQFILFSCSEWTQQKEEWIKKIDFYSRVAHNKSKWKESHINICWTKFWDVTEIIITVERKVEILISFFFFFWYKRKAFDGFSGFSFSLCMCQSLFFGPCIVTN